MTGTGRKTEYNYSYFQNGVAGLSAIRIAPYALNLNYRFHYDATARLDSITDPAGRILLSNATASGLDSLRAPGTSVSTVISYDSDRRLTTWRSPRMFTTTYSYHGAPWPSAYLASSTVASIGSGVYTPVQLQGLLTSTTQPNISVRSDSAFAVIDGLRNEVADIARFRVNGFNAPTLMIDPRGYTTSWSYDTGNPLLVDMIVDPGNGLQRMTYDNLGRMTSYRDDRRPAGIAITNYLYEDARVPDRPTRLISPREGNARDTLTLTYIARGLLQSARDSLGATTFTYNANSQVERIASPTFDYTRFRYDARGNMDSTQVGGFWTGYTRDIYGNVNIVTPPLGSPIITHYTPLNLPDTVKTHNDIYNGSNVLLRTVMTYDAEGNLRARRNAGGLLREWDYDALGRPTHIEDELDKVELRSYTADGLLRKITRRDGGTVEVFYDAAGLPEKRISHPGLNTGAISDSVYFDHNALGLPTIIGNRSVLIKRTYFADGSINQEVDSLKWNQWKLALTYTYTLAGARKTMQLDANTPLAASRTYTYRYRTTNFLAGIDFIDGLGAARAINFTPDAADRRKSVALPGQPTVNFTFNDAGALETATGIANWGYHFTFDAMLRPKTLTGIGVAGNWDYDKVGQVINTNEGSFAYDEVGNRRREDSYATFIYVLYPNSNRLQSRCSDESPAQCTLYFYNDNGDLVKDSIPRDPTPDLFHLWYYDGEGRVTSLSQQAAEEFRYDGLGRMVLRRDGTGSVVTFYDGENVAWSHGAFFITGLETDDILGQIGPPGTTCYFVPHGGRLLYTSCPQQWSQVGENSGLIANSFNFGLTRTFEDSSSTSYFRNRWYDSKTGRFTQEDPIGFGGGGNLYAYAGNNPATYTDPFGLCPPEKTGRPCGVFEPGHDAVQSAGIFDPITFFAGGVIGGVRAFGARLLSGFGTAARDAVATSVVEGGVLKTSGTVARQLAGQRSFIPSHGILETIRGGTRIADPQGAAGRFMYRAQVQFTHGDRVSKGTLEVLVDEARGVIEHVLYKSGGVK